MLKGFADLADYPEDDRITAIGRYVEQHPGELVAVVVDADPTGAKATRYVAKLSTRYRVQIVDVQPGPVDHATLIRVRAKD